MPAFTTRLADGWQRALGSLSLALVPLVLALADVNKLRAVLAFDGVHVGFRLGLPVSVVTLWQFVSVPQSGVNVDAGVPLDALPLAAVTVPVFLVVQAGLTAGYFGSIATRLRTGEYRFVENVTAYFVPFLVLTVLPVLLLLPIALGLFGLGATGGTPGGLLAVVVLAVPVFVVVAYLFYATPYLVVLRETGVLAAARVSYGLAVSGGAYLSYAAGVALCVLALSPIATFVVVSASIVGLPLGLVAGSVFGLALNTATMCFVADVDDACAGLVDWEDGSEVDDGDEVDEGDDEVDHTDPTGGFDTDHTDGFDTDHTEGFDR